MGGREDLWLRDGFPALPLRKVNKLGDHESHGSARPARQTEAQPSLFGGVTECQLDPATPRLDKHKPCLVGRGSGFSSWTEIRVT